MLGNLVAGAAVRCRAEPGDLVGNERVTSPKRARAGDFRWASRGRFAPAIRIPIALELACVLTGALMGAIGGFATYLRRGADGRPLGRAGWLAAGMWVGGVGARLAFAVAANNGAGPAIARFSVANHITGEAAWIAALIMMALADVLTRLVIIYLRGRRLTASAPAPVAPIAGGVGA